MAARPKFRVERIATTDGTRWRVVRVARGDVTYPCVHTWPDREHAEELATLYTTRPDLFSAPLTEIEQTAGLLIR